MEDITKQVEDILRTTKVIPLHTHNGVDSLLISSANISSALSQAGVMLTSVYDVAGVAQQLVGISAIQTLTNKSIDGGSNTITGITEASFNFSDVTTANASITKHGLLPKLPNDNTKFLDGTGAYSTPVTGNVNTLIATYTAGQALTTGQPVSIQIAPANDIVFDNKAMGRFSSSLSVSFTVGNNSNRGLVVLLMANNNTTNTINSFSYNGVNMSLVVDSTAGSHGHGYALYLNAPATGSNTLAIGATGGTTSWDYYVYSYYNVSQSGQPEANTSTVAGTLPQTMSLAPLSNGGLVLGVLQGGTWSGTGFTNNVQSVTSGGQFSQAGDSGNNYPPKTVNFTQNATTNESGVAISIAPFTASGSTNKVYLASSALAVNANSFIGFSQGNYSASANANVAIAGLDNFQSGLTIGGQYYLNDTAGTIGIAAGTVTRKVGIATLSSSILITNIW